MRSIKITLPIFLAAAIILTAAFFRLYFINFGLPHSFYADEPEFTEPAIKYTYEIRNIIKNNDYYQLIPISFVYGTFPVYFLTFSLIIFSKTLNLLHIVFDKTTIFIFLRVILVLISLIVVRFTGILAKKNFGTAKTYLYALILAALNWKLIVHAHYVNADIILTALLLVSFYYLFKYDKQPNNLNLFLAALFFGLAVGTKITALISLPMYLYVVAVKKDIYGFPGFILSALLAYIISNPFSVLFFGDFSFRIFSMLTKEGGMVFDSVDTSPFKYITGLSYMITTPVLLASLYGIYIKIKTSREKTFDYFLIGNIVMYFLFFSIQSRRVDRWLLPIIPIILIYAAFAFTTLEEKIKSPIQKILLFTIIFAVYLVNPFLLLQQFQRWTPKSQAYLWAQQNLPETSTKLIYSEEGLDPMNKLDFAKVIQFQVYASEEAQFVYPENPFFYDYVIVSSRPMENFKRPQVVAAYPNYAKKWMEFEKTLQNPNYFTLVKDFTLPKPNLIPLSDVFVYKNVIK